VSSDDDTSCSVGAQPAHRAQPVFELAVVGFDPVVGIPLDVVPCGGDQFVKHGRVDRCGVGDHLGRGHLQGSQRPLEESAGRVSVSAGRDQHVDDLPVLVNGPVHVAPHAIDLDVRLVHEPPVTGRVPAEPGGIREQRCEPLYPAQDRDVIDLDTAFDQQFLHVALRQAVAQVPTNRHHDHLSREPEAREGGARRSRGRTTAGELHRSRMP